MSLRERITQLSAAFRRFIHTICSPQSHGIRTADPHYKPRPKRTADQIQKLKMGVEQLRVHVLCAENRKTFPLNVYKSEHEKQKATTDRANQSEENSDYPRVIIVGDIHGCARELQLLLEKVNFVKGVDILVLTGDIMVKGGESQDALRLAMENKAFFVRGNHDWEILRRHGRASPECDIDSSDTATTHDRIAHSLNEEELAYLSSAPHLLYIPQYDTVVVHASVRYPDILNTNAYDAMHGRNYVFDQEENATVQCNVEDSPVSLEDTHNCILNSEENQETLNVEIHEDLSVGVSWAETYPRTYNGKQLPFVVFGHDARRGLQIFPNAYGIDTGCAYGRQLTALVLPGRELFHVDKLA